MKVSAGKEPGEAAARLDGGGNAEQVAPGAALTAWGSNFVLPDPPDLWKDIVLACISPP